MAKIPWRQLVQVIIWIGPTIYGKLQGHWRKIFHGKQFVILGPKGAGKTSLLLFLKHGRPLDRDDDDGEWVTPSPTVGKHKRAAKRDTSQGERLRVTHDYSGDPTFRRHWRAAMKKEAPEGIIFMIDGQVGETQLQDAIAALFDDALAFGDCEKCAPHTVSILLNFADKWGGDERETRRKCRIVEELFERRAAGNEYFQHQRLAVDAVSLAPNENEWRAVESALRRFGDNMGDKSKSLKAQHAR